MIKTLIDPQRVHELAFSNSQIDYTSPLVIAPIEIRNVEQRHLIPVIGEPLYEALERGEYPTLLDDYVAPALALYVHEAINAPTSPASKRGLQSARLAMQSLSRHLDQRGSQYPEYNPDNDVLKRCRINGYNIQIR